MVAGPGALIPRYAGDVPDPRGGIRWVVPDRAPYRDDEGSFVATYRNPGENR